MTGPCEKRRSEAVAAHGAKQLSTTLFSPFDESESCAWIGFELDDSERCLAGRPADIAREPAALEGRLVICQCLYQKTLEQWEKAKGKGTVPALHF